MSVIINIIIIIMIITIIIMIMKASVGENWASKKQVGNESWHAKGDDIAFVYNFRNDQLVN